MNFSTWGAMDWIVAAVPLVFIVAAVRIGSLQVREFRRRSGDRGLLTNVLGMAGGERHHRVHTQKASAPKSTPARKRAKRSAPDEGADASHFSIVAAE
jgi:hypothetical protein